ncbi:uncharacterized protein LOC112693992 isoform X2 [Sipha flava]|uniref:Uncharacterized protein LOC112693992 isoform X2 n=1 Tax=Sipha flava TaxID=143950 RepID=A0A8B8GPR9_9HEMI|nr:uncharacterized protein LOC112693992 isoform X2 [Sipha flava]
MSSFSNNLIQNPQTSHAIQQVQQNSASTNFNSTLINDSMKPLDDPKYLWQNSFYFQQIQEQSKMPVKQKSKKNEIFQFTNQFLYGTYMPPYYSVLNFPLMEKLVLHQKNPKAPLAKLLMMHKELIDQERELFDQWLSSIWEENLKNRRLTVIPHVEEYIKSAYNFSNCYIKSHYNGKYTSKMKIDYNREECEMEYKVEMVHCLRVKKSNMVCSIQLPKIDITDVESKISFKDHVYIPPQKSQFIKDELCHELMKEHSCEISMCLSSLKHIMSLEKPNSVWLIPVNINTDIDNLKTVHIGGALSTGHFSQQDKSLYYLRKELKRKFRELVLEDENGEEQNGSIYNYDKWNLNVNEINGILKKSFNILIRNKPHIRSFKKSNHEQPESVLMPKVEYQPEFGFEKLCEEQLIEYWLDTYFRNPKTKITLFSVQYNMDIMMVKKCLNIENCSENLERVKKMRLQRLYITLDKLSKLDTGEYVLLHNPKKPFQVEVYQLSTFIWRFQFIKYVLCLTTD